MPKQSIFYFHPTFCKHFTHFLSTFFSHVSFSPTYENFFLLLISLSYLFSCPNKPIPTFSLLLLSVLKSKSKIPFGSFYFVFLSFFSLNQFPFILSGLIYCEPFQTLRRHLTLWYELIKVIRSFYFQRYDFKTMSDVPKLDAGALTVTIGAADGVAYRDEQFR